MQSSTEQNLPSLSFSNVFDDDQTETTTPPSQQVVNPTPQASSRKSLDQRIQADAPLHPAMQSSLERNFLPTSFSDFFYDQQMKAATPSSDQIAKPTHQASSSNSLDQRIQAGAPLHPAMQSSTEEQNSLPLAFHDQQMKTTMPSFEQTATPPIPNPNR